ncbi:MAG TPA: cytochrome C oxidase subunit IV family protein [Chitinophagaceae bacterium]|nr:cytochrome C oxidase subunit IV family protein [Chitinophagaceae bacterium]
MEQHHQTISPEVTFHHAPSDDTVKRIWKTTWVLSGITLVELALGFGIAKSWYGDSSGLILAVKGVICILSLAKAFYIVSIFMHLGDEIRNMIMTIVVPLLLFVWFITAFIWDGNSYKNLRNKYDPYFKETTMPVKHKEEKKEVPAENKSGKE